MMFSKLFNTSNIIIALLGSILCLLLFDRFVPETARVVEQSPISQSVSRSSDDSHEGVLNFILNAEGGVRKELGHGGYSNRGITQETWQHWRATQGDRSHLPAEVRDADLPLTKRFYYDYFAGYHVWDVHPALQLLYADFAVLAGGEATREVQRLVGANPDGVWGSRTAAKVAVFNATLTTAAKQSQAFERLDAMKRKYLTWLGSHPNHKKDLKGWLQRADDVKTYMAQ